MNAPLKIVGQAIALGTVCFLGFSLSWEQIPGNKNICDAGQWLYGMAWFIFTTSCLALFINSLIFLKKRNWIKYRIIVIIICSLLILTSLNIRSILFQTSYGKIKLEIQNAENNYELIQIKLYENGKFYSTIYDMSCKLEYIGTYQLNENILILKFKNEKSEYLGTEYYIKNKKLICTKNCEDINELNLK
ncbi:hypothetical protein [Neotamlana laminarinivorans]|uniref:Uncharacterized protein n=1 Tax=Neotamlana laminarinivorans TaxID=2883124 RepID=A0A9X1I2Q4_9FLAO|nr:hypothetical protein [Tamlana laminarinivorans]MCB4800281.1 hypothetical protein [Tamlana laminarinivorans]